VIDTYHVVNSSDADKGVDQVHCTEHQRVHIDEQQEAVLRDEEQNDDTDLHE